MAAAMFVYILARATAVPYSLHVEALWVAVALSFVAFEARFLAAVPIALIDGSPPLAALRESWRLTSGNGRRTAVIAIGALLLGFLVASNLVARPLVETFVWPFVAAFRVSTWRLLAAGMPPPQPPSRLTLTQSGKKKRRRRRA